MNCVDRKATTPKRGAYIQLVWIFIAVLFVAQFLFSQVIVVGAVKKVPRGPHVTILEPRGAVRIVPVGSKRKDRTPVKVEVAGLRSTAPVSLGLAVQCKAHKLLKMSTASSSFRKPRNGKVSATINLGIRWEKAAGKTCDVDVFVRKKVGNSWEVKRLPGKKIRVAPVKYYFIRSTWAMRNLLKPRIQKKNGACSGQSVGAAGVVNVGIIKRNNDMVFEIRSGPTGTECIFKTIKLPLKEHWWVKELKYRKVRLKGRKDLCYSSYGPHFAAQRGTISLNKWDVHLKCNGTGVNPLENNNHGIRFIFDSLTLMGPTGRKWRNAFK
ncbi:MAG: hypothetical protein ACU84Q_20025 [Gammaproteobacteria bacterium]|jgi:hypothetical protein